MKFCSLILTYRIKYVTIYIRGTNMKRKQKELIDYNNVAHTIVGASLAPVIRIDALYSTCYYKYNKNFIFKGERHDFWELVYVDNGNVIIESEQDRFELFQSQFYLHAPNEFHTIRSDSMLSNVFIFSFDSSSPALCKLLKTVIDATHKQAELLGNAFKYAQVILSPNYMPKIILKHKKKIPNRTKRCSVVYHLAERAGFEPAVRG